MDKLTARFYRGVSPIADSLEEGFPTFPMRNAAEMRDTSRDADEHIDSNNDSSTVLPKLYKV